MDFFDTAMFGTGFTISGLLAGILIGLKIIAPRTKNKYDDKVLQVAEVLVPVLRAKAAAEQATADKTKAQADKAEADARNARPKHRDHRK